MRVAARAPRWALYGLALAGLVGNARLVVAPPRPVVRTVLAAREDHAARAAALAFARAYLAVDGQNPDAARQRLAAITGPNAAAEIAPDAPPLVRRRVRSVDVVADRPGAGGARVVVVAADTEPRGLVHLAVTVARARDGALQIVGAPALVGGPVLADAALDPDVRRAEVTDAALSEVCRRALENYLAGAARNLAADLSADARVSLPDVALRLERLRQLRWTLDGRSVAATVDARDADGVRHTLRYALDVVRVRDRWEISALATDPTA